MKVGDLFGRFKQEKRKPLEMPSNVRISQDNNVTHIDITKDISMREYAETLDKNAVASLPVREIIEGYDLLTATVKQQDIYVIPTSDCFFCIAQAKNIKKISQCKTVIWNNEEHIEEVVLEDNQSDYRVIRYVHKMNRSTRLSQSYCSKDGGDTQHSLQKAEALTLVQDVLENIKASEAAKYVDVFHLYAIYHLISNNTYFPVIGDEMLTLSWHHDRNNTDMSSHSYWDFDILLNETREKIGDIGYQCSQSKQGFTYSGNVDYFIYQKFRHMHYATRALHLLKQFLANHFLDEEKDLYISAFPDNIYSQNVALKNGAELVYEGEVPETETMRTIDGIEEIKVYQIKLGKESNE